MANLFKTKTPNRNASDAIDFEVTVKDYAKFKRELKAFD